MINATAFILVLACWAQPPEGDAAPAIVPPLVPHATTADDTAHEEAAPEEQAPPTSEAAQGDTSEAEARAAAFADWMTRASAGDDSVRAAAWQECAARSPEDVPELVGHLLNGTAAEVLAANAALDDLVYTRPAEVRAAVADALIAHLPSTTANTESDLSDSSDSSVQYPEPGSGLWPLLAALRNAVEMRNAAFSTQTDVERVALVQRELLGRVASVASARHVPALRQLLVSDPASIEGVLDVLVHLPGEEVGQALAEALAQAAPEHQIRIADALARRGGESGTEALRRLAMTGPESTTWACLDALAHLGVPPSAVPAPGGMKSFEESARYAGIALRAAQVLADRGDKASAEKILVSFFDLHALRYQVRAALAAIGRLGSPASVRYAVGYLNVPGVRETAIRVLAASTAPNVEQELLDVFAKGDTAMQASVLEVLSKRNSPAAGSLIAEAMRAESPELRFVAAQLAGATPSEEDLGYLAIKGDPALSQRALRVYLDLAHTRAISGDAAAAATQFRAIIDGPFPVGARREALEGLGQLGLESDRALVQDYVSDPYLSEAAFVALARITAAQPDPEKAREELGALARSAPTGAAQTTAVEALAGLGADTAEFGLQQGFVAEWRVLGPFPNRQDEAFGKSFFDETKSDAVEVVEYQGAQFEWRSVSAKGLPAIVDLAEVYGPYQEAAAYAAAKVQVPRWTTVEVCIGVDEPFELWINGEKKHESRAERVFQEDAERAPGLLKPGINRILLKVLQGSGDWKFCARIVERRGAPLDLSKQQLPEDGTTGVGVGASTALNSVKEALP